MIRITHGFTTRKKNKKFLKLTKGYRGINSRLSTAAYEQTIQSLYFNYISRKLKKRNFRKIWISRINTIIYNKNINYSTFIGNLKFLKIYINKKILSYLILNDIILINIIIKKLII